MATLFDLGYNEFLQKPIVGNDLTGGLISTQNVRTISGSKIRGGRLASSDGRSYFDLDINKQIIINDGTNDRILIGKIS